MVFKSLSARGIQVELPLSLQLEVPFDRLIFFFQLPHPWKRPPRTDYRRPLPARGGPERRQAVLRGRGDPPDSVRHRSRSVWLRGQGGQAAVTNLGEKSAGLRLGSRRRRGFPFQRILKKDCLIYVLQNTLFRLALSKFAYSLKKKWKINNLRNQQVR